MKNWGGVWTATITPFYNDKVDEAAITKIVSGLVRDGVSGFCPCGTTGEGWSLSDEEFSTVVEATLKGAGKNISVVPGTGTIDTRRTIDRTLLAKKTGATAAMVVTPCYAKPTQEGLIRHFSEVAEKSDFPIMIYNIPGRTSVNMLPATVAQLAKDPRIAAIKEASTMEQTLEVIRLVGPHLRVFTGEDSLFLRCITSGAAGVVSVIANIVPKIWVSVFDLVTKGKIDIATKSFLEHVPLIDLLFSEPNPIPLKAAMAMMTGYVHEELRLPLVKMSTAAREKLRQEMLRLGILSS